MVFQTITISIFSIKNISRHQQKNNFIQSEWKVGKKKKDEDVYLEIIFLKNKENENGNQDEI